MQYLVFGVLLMLGAVIIGLSLLMVHLRNRVKAVVVENRCDVKRDDIYIEEITITHRLALKDGEEERVLETELVPVRELKDAELNLYYDRKTRQIYVPDYKKYIPLLGAFVLSGLFCFTMFVIKDVSLFTAVLEKEWLAFLFAVIGLATFSYAGRMVSPAVVKTKGSFEGILKHEDGSIDSEVYSLWYGEHRQYAKRIPGMPVKHSGNPVILFYNTRTGVVCRVHELVVSMCVSVVAFAAMVVAIII